MHHDSVATGHPGRAKTLELVSRNYWWPDLTKFVHKYVDGCDICQRTKNFPSKPQGPLLPNEIPEGPWQNITVDFVTDLPPSEGKTAIMVTKCQLIKMGKFIPCTKTVDAEESADMFERNVWKLFGTPKKVTSDRGPQFTSKFLRALFKKLNIHSALSTAFHPQTDGQSERTIQSVEQYLRAFCNFRKTDWMKYLHLAEFAHNNQVHSSIGISPFQAMYGYNPNWEIPPNPYCNVPAVQTRLETLKEIQNEIKASLQITAERMKLFYDRHVKDMEEFQKGDKVWLDGKNVKTNEPSAKLADKRYGPFVILDKIGTHNFRLKLPHQWKIHPVFHITLLSRHKKDKIPGRTPKEPPPFEVQGAEEYEVEDILDSRIYRKGLQYLVKWKGYLSNENTWEPARNVRNAAQKVRNFHSLHPDRPRPIAEPTQAARAIGGDRLLYDWKTGKFET